MSVKENVSLGIFGATGVVGAEILEVLEERALSFSEIRLFASADSEGELYSFAGEEIEVEVLDEERYLDLDYAFMALPRNEVSELLPALKKSSVTLIDVSGATRNEKEAICVIPELNGELCQQKKGLFSNPTALTVEVAPVLFTLNQISPIKRIVASSYQSVATAGQVGLDELWEQTRAVFSQEPVTPEAFSFPIAFNCIPQIDTFLESGVTGEESRFERELQLTLGLPELKVSLTAVRIPAFHGDGISLNVEFEEEVTPQSAVEHLKAVSYLEVAERNDQFPVTIEAATESRIFIGRIRVDQSVPFGLNLWVVADGLRRGTAWNAVSILEKLLDNEHSTRN